MATTVLDLLRECKSIVKLATDDQRVNDMIAPFQGTNNTQHYLPSTSVIHQPNQIIEWDNVITSRLAVIRATLRSSQRIAQLTSLFPTSIESQKASSQLLRIMRDKLGVNTTLYKERMVLSRFISLSTRGILTQLNAKYMRNYALKAFTRLFQSYGLVDLRQKTRTLILSETTDTAKNDFEILTQEITTRGEAFCLLIEFQFEDPENAVDAQDGMSSYDSPPPQSTHQSTAPQLQRGLLTPTAAVNVIAIIDGEDVDTHNESTFLTGILRAAIEREAILCSPDEPFNPDKLNANTTKIKTAAQQPTDRSAQDTMALTTISQYAQSFASLLSGLIASESVMKRVSALKTLADTLADTTVSNNAESIGNPGEALPQWKHITDSNILSFTPFDAITLLKTTVDNILSGHASYKERQQLLEASPSTTAAIQQLNTLSNTNQLPLAMLDDYLRNSPAYQFRGDITPCMRGLAQKLSVRHPLYESPPVNRSLLAEAAAFVFQHGHNIPETSRASEVIQYMASLPGGIHHIISICRALTAYLPLDIKPRVLTLSAFHTTQWLRKPLYKTILDLMHPTSLMAPTNPHVLTPVVEISPPLVVPITAYERYVQLFTCFPGMNQSNTVDLHHSRHGQLGQGQQQLSDVSGMPDDNSAANTELSPTIASLSSSYLAKQHQYFSIVTDDTIATHTMASPVPSTPVEHIERIRDDQPHALQQPDILTPTSLDLSSNATTTANTVAWFLPFLHPDGHEQGKPQPASLAQTSLDDDFLLDQDVDHFAYAFAPYPYPNSQIPRNILRFRRLCRLLGIPAIQLTHDCRHSQPMVLRQLPLPSPVLTYLATASTASAPGAGAAGSSMAAVFPAILEWISRVMLYQQLQYGLAIAHVLSPSSSPSLYAVNNNTMDTRTAQQHPAVSVHPPVLGMAEEITSSSDASSLTISHADAMPDLSHLSIDLGFFDSALTTSTQDKSTNTMENGLSTPGELNSGDHPASFQNIHAVVPPPTDITMGDITNSGGVPLQHPLEHHLHIVNTDDHITCLLYCPENHVTVCITVSMALLPVASPLPTPTPENAGNTMKDTINNMVTATATRNDHDPIHTSIHMPLYYHHLQYMHNESNHANPTQGLKSSLLKRHHPEQKQSEASSNHQPPQKPPIACESSIHITHHAPTHSHVLESLTSPLLLRLYPHGIPMDLSHYEFTTLSHALPCDLSVSVFHSSHDNTQGQGTHPPTAVGVTGEKTASPSPSPSRQDLDQFLRTYAVLLLPVLTGLRSIPLTVIWFYRVYLAAFAR